MREKLKTISIILCTLGVASTVTFGIIEAKRDLITGLLLATSGSIIIMLISFILGGLIPDRYDNLLGDMIEKNERLERINEHRAEIIAKANHDYDCLKRDNEELKQEIEWLKEVIKTNEEVQKTIEEIEAKYSI